MKHRNLKLKNKEEKRKVILYLLLSFIIAQLSQKLNEILNFNIIDKSEFSSIQKFRRCRTEKSKRK